MGTPIRIRIRNLVLDSFFETGFRIQLPRIVFEIFSVTRSRKHQMKRFLETEFDNNFVHGIANFRGAPRSTRVGRRRTLWLVDRAGFEPAALRSRVSAFPHSGSKDDLPSGRSSASPNALCTRLIYRPTRPRNSRRTIKWVLSSVGFRSRNVLTVVYNLGHSLKNSYI